MPWLSGLEVIKIRHAGQVETAVSDIAAMA
jgi:hypothetical protein